MFTLNCKGRLMVYDKPAVMGILNVTPDSFYAESREMDLEAILEKAETMITEGADFIDIGGQSTRPGSERVSEQEELARVIPAIRAIHQKYPEAVLSVDTFYAGVAQAAVEAGASVVNDVSAGSLDERMIPSVAALRVPYVVMHMKGDPQTMTGFSHYENVTAEVLDALAMKVIQCREAGIHDVIVDPGFGFSKNISQNFKLLAEMSSLKITGCPVLVGLSRKSLIYRTLGITPEESLNGTIALNTLALEHGADILRVHDVKEAVETVTLMEAYKKGV